MLGLHVGALLDFDGRDRSAPRRDKVELAAKHMRAPGKDLPAVEA